MTTEEIVKRLMELVAEGKNIQAEEELYAPDAVSYEQDGRVVTGLEGIKAKTQAAIDGTEESYGGGIRQAFVHPEGFLLVFEMDFKPKGGERMQMKEYGFYKVANGKIAEEHFFAQPLA
jgi:hypothetical protein